MIFRLIIWLRERRTRQSSKRDDRATRASEKRASTKLTAAYEKRRVRELSHRRDLFERDIAGTRKGLG